MNPSPHNSLASRAQHLAAAFLALFSVVPLANAHPGHSLTGASPAHLLASPDHLAVLLLLGAAMCLGAQFVHQHRLRRALQFAGSVAALGALICFGLRS
jgi:hypothetical protein